MGILQTLFGGSSEKSSAKNVNNNLLTTNLGGNLGLVSQGTSALQRLLGGDSSGFDSYKRAGGFDWATRQGGDGIMGSMAAKGLLRSGASGKALMNYGNQMSNQYLQNYISNLLGLSDVGLKSAGVLAESGKTQESSGSKSSGVAGFLGSILSDRRLKKDVVRLGTLDNGLPLYEYTYTFGGGRHVGVMADDVRKIQPEALGEKIGPFDTVNYERVLNGISR